MFKGLFGGKDDAARGDDRVWINHAARLQGLGREVKSLAEAGRSVVVVALTPAAFDELEAALAAHQPLRCVDIFGKDELRAGLARQGSVAIALSQALPLDVKAGPDVEGRADLLVYGRHDSRAADEAIVRFADGLGPHVQITFHLSLDDKLMQKFGGSIRPLLERLGMRADAPIANSMVTRAIRNVQDKA